MKKVASGNNSFGEQRPGCGYTTHAEMAALKQLRRKGYTKVVDMWSVRVTRSGATRNAKPCERCLAHFRWSGVRVRRVYWTTDEGEVEYETFSKLTSTYKTRGLR